MLREPLIRSCWPGAAMLLLGPAAAAQSILIDVDQPVLRRGERAQVTLLAAFPAYYYAMGLVELDFATSVGSSGWSDFSLAALRGPFATPGVPSATGVDGILAWQLNFTCADCGAVTHNPITFWKAVYTAPATRANFDVDLATSTARFLVYPARSSTDLIFLTGVLEAAGAIHVVGCLPDCDESGALDLFDFLCFQNAFAAGDPYADCDTSGTLDLFDFLCFQNAFAAGCP